MNEITEKPIPVITDLTKPFWQAAKENRFVLQQCRACKTMNFHPKPWCIECGSRDLFWTKASPGGTVYSYTISRVIAMNYPGWEKDLPVLLCLIDLDDGARMYAQVTDCSPDDISIGMRVEVYLDKLTEEISIPKFRPA